MKIQFQITAAMGLILASSRLLQADIIVPGANGTDGALNVTENLVVDLSRAAAGKWDDDNTANRGRGIYDSNKWAVVFKYTDVTIATGAKVTFKNHASRAPVVWLVSGSVMIQGVLSLNGQIGLPAPALAEPGPGGFRGGAGYFGPGVGASAGFGVGGGSAIYPGYGGSFGGVGPANPPLATSQPTYGNMSLIPLIGGSGGGGWPGLDLAGGGGGGSILIAVGGSITIDGTIQADGGQGVSNPVGDFGSGGGSGGGIRLVSGNLGGGGVIQALGGTSRGYAGGLGRIRVERVNNTYSGDPNPSPSVVRLEESTTAVLWPPTGAPEVRIVSIGGKEAPADPRAAFGTVGADVILPLTSSTVVLVETTNVEEAAEVYVRGTPRVNGNFTEIKAQKTAKLSDNPLVVRWTADLPVNAGYAAVQVKVVRP